MANEKINILKLLIENQDKEYSIRQISHLRKINYKSAYTNIKKLKAEKIATVKKHGNISLCSFNRNFNEYVYRAEHERRSALLKNKNFRIMHDRMSKINNQFILLLFGSCAKKTETKHSDIDLLLISDRSKQVRDELELLPFDTHLTHVTYKDFIAMLKSKESTVVSEAVKRNIILFGTEDYYRLIENAK